MQNEPGGDTGASRVERLVFAHVMAGMRIGSRRLCGRLLAAGHLLAFGLPLLAAGHLSVGVHFAATAGHVVASVFGVPRMIRSAFTA